MALDYDLNRSLRLVTDPEFKSLYSWAIIETDASGKKLGNDQIPWDWRIAFVATEIVLSDQLTIKQATQGDKILREDEENSQRRLIRAKLRPGSGRGEMDWRRPKLSIFGTDRVVEDITLDILQLDSEEEPEVCTAWGTPAYDYEDDGQDDCLVFYLQVRPSTFDMYARRIADGTADEIEFVVSRVDGFYAEWSPDISTRAVKILTRTKEQLVELPPGEKFEPPRLGNVGGIELFISAKRAHSKKLAGDLEDDDTPHSLVRPEATVLAAGTSDPAVAKGLQDLSKSAGWIIGMLILLLIAVIIKR